MNDDTWRFLTVLYARCTSPACIALSALPPADRFYTPSRHIPLGNSEVLQDALERLAVTNCMGWGAVVGIATRQSGLTRYKRGGKADLCELPAVFVDIDCNDSSSLNRIQVCGLPPSIQVASGYGQHSFWLLDKPAYDFRWADRVLHGLAEQLHGDRAINSASAMRLPGTINTKPDRNGAWCRLLELHAERCYPVEAFTPYLSKNMETNVTRASQPLIASTLLHWTRDEYARIIQAVEDCLIRHFDGFWKPNGWLSSLCPCGHKHDRPGQHFGFHASHRIGHCFGKHGRIDLMTLCDMLHLV